MSPLRRLWNVVRRSRMDDDLRQELDTHVALIEEEERRQGLTADQARRNARTRFGNPHAYRERALDAVIATWFEHACKDVRFAARVLRRAPGFLSSRRAYHGARHRRQCGHLFDPERLLSCAPCRTPNPSS